MCLISFFQNDPSVHNTGHLYPNVDNPSSQQGTVLANQEHAIELSGFSAPRINNFHKPQQTHDNMVENRNSLVQLIAKV